jgi:hypothetical protein
MEAFVSEHSHSIVIFLVSQLGLVDAPLTSQ